MSEKVLVTVVDRSDVAKRMVTGRSDKKGRLHTFRGLFGFKKARKLNEIRRVRTATDTEFK